MAGEEDGRRIALVATLRNEGPFIVEWVAYHRLIGFTELIVCTNDCEDGSPELLDALEALGLLVHIRCHPPPAEPAQMFAYRQVEARLAGAWPDWLMTLDGDEFLNIHVGGGSVPELINAGRQATTILINWRIFGSSGHHSWSPELVTRRFNRAATLDHGVNWSFKTLFGRPDAYHCPLMAHGPGFAKEERLGELRPVDGAGRPLPDTFARSDRFLQTEPGGVSWALAQVNHYNTRSREDYLAKHHRGGGLGPGRWDREGNWAVFDRNEEEDRSIARHLPALERAVGALLADPRVRAAYDRCLDGYGRYIARLAAA